MDALNYWLAHCVCSTSARYCLWLSSVVTAKMHFFRCCFFDCILLLYLRSDTVIVQQINGFVTYLLTEDTSWLWR